MSEDLNSISNASQEGNVPPASPCKILIVEDDVSMVTMLSAMLEDEGYIVSSGVGLKALDMARQDPPDLILLYIMMPIMNGLEWSNRAKADPALQNIPILALSAAESGTLKTIYKDLQADSYLPKPFDMNVLMNLVHSLSHNS